jgi:hypothetical protein
LARKKLRQPREDRPVESRAIETATVAWMLSAITTLLCESIAGLAWILSQANPVAENILLLARYLHFCSLVTAVVTLALTAVVLKGRREPPPRAIVIFAVFVAALPILAIFF